MITNKQIYEKLEKIEKLLEKEEVKLELEDHNFRVDSTGWIKKEKDGVEYLENPKGDIWEYINLKDNPELNGEQLFTWDAAMRETKKIGKRVPTDEQWSQLVKTKDDFPYLVCAGYRNTDGSFGNLTTYGSFWSSLESGSSAWNRDLNSSYATVYRYTDSKAYGFSLRCLKD